MLEVVIGSHKSTPLALMPTLGGLESLLKTGDITIACRDEAMKSKLVEDSTLASEIVVNVLDVSLEQPAEDLKDHKYDVVVASGFSDCMTEFGPAIENITRLLKKKGNLCLLEATHAVDKVQKALDTWHIETMAFPNIYETQSLQASLVVAQRSEGPLTNGINGHDEPQEVMLVEATKASASSQAVASSLTADLENAGYKTTSFVWGSDMSILSGKPVISLLELETSVLQNLTDQDFTLIKKLVLEATSIFWVVGFDDPSAAMIDGFARVVRNETPGLLFRTFHTEKRPSLPAENFTKLISRAFSSTLEDDEYLVRDNLIHVSRIEEDDSLNEQINSLLPGAQGKIVNMPLKEAQHPLKLCIPNPGMLDSLCLEADEVPDTDLEEDFIEIQVKATALNFREVMVAMGQISDSKLGLDAAGIVHRIGSSVTKFKVGDRVAMYGHGSHKTFHRSRASYCALIPEGLSFEQAASIPTAQGTAWNALVRLAQVRKGQSVLVHAAAGGVGQAAIQIAKHFEMEIFATVSSEVKRKLIRDEYGIPNDHIFGSRNLSFVKGVKRMTKGRGVDVVLNSLAGEALRQTWHCIAPFGYFIEIGLKDILGNTELDMRPFIQDSTFSFFNLTHIEKSRPDIMGAIIEGAFDFLRRGITRPITPLVTYPISDVEGAFRLMQTGKHLGKIALTWGDDHIVPVIQQNKSSPRLDPKGVYMLSGGLGGLGRSLSTKLINLGARKLCFLSRSGGRAAQARELIRDLEEQNVRVKAYKCDVADEKAVASAITKCTSELGNIRGVFQCAMVLRDTTFMNMTYQQWTESTRPKVQGSWNLHQHLPKVDFFITLSSFAAIFGNRGQANYSAAGAYEDALAYYRRAHGQHATTLDLGIMRDIGVLAESGMTDSLREWEKPYGIPEPEFLALVEQAIAGDMAGTVAPQVLTGLATGGSALAAGISTPFYLENARFSIMAKTGVRGQSSESGQNSVSAQALVSEAKSFEEAAGHVLDALVKHIAKMLQTPAAEIDTSRFLHSYGIDSLVAIEIVNWALKEVKSTVNVFDVLAGVPITTFSNKIAAKSGVLSKELVPM